jgi:hypothetical protein
MGFKSTFGTYRQGYLFLQDSHIGGSPGHTMTGLFAQMTVLMPMSSFPTEEKILIFHPG